MIRILKQLMNGWYAKGMELMESNTNFPYRIAAFGERNFGGRFRMGNRVYSSDHISVALLSQPVGSLGGQTNLYLVTIDE